MYTTYINAVDRSDQVLNVNSVARKCYRWWKTLFSHLIAIVNGFILFREYRERSPDDEALQRSRNYTRGKFRAEILRDFCNFPEYGSPPLYTANQPAPVEEIDTIHMP